MRKGWILSLMTVLLTAFGASAQEVTARIAGLENNTEYMEMLRKEAALQIREDSITKVVHRVRQLLRDNPEQRNENTAEILRCEELLFTIRTERGKLTDRINTIEQDWVLANLDLNSQAEEQRAHTAYDEAACIDDEGNPLSFCALVAMACLCLHVRPPRNPRSRACMAARRKGVRRENGRIIFSAGRRRAPRGCILPAGGGIMGETCVRKEAPP